MNVGKYIVSMGRSLVSKDARHSIGIRNIHYMTSMPNFSIDNQAAYKKDIYLISSQANFSVYRLYIKQINSNKYLHVCWFADGVLYENDILMI